MSPVNEFAYLQRLLALLFIILAFAKQTSAQNIFKGSILSAETKRPVPYASVQLVNAKKSVSSNEEGLFVFKLDSLLNNDSIVFSSIGFETISFSLNNLPEGNIFEIQPVSKLLNQVEVQSYAYQHETKLKKLSWSNNYWGGGSDHEMAQLLYAPFQHCRVSRVRFYLSSWEKKFDRIFQLEFYDVDSSGKPGKLIYDSLILIHTSGKIKLQVDLNEYKITLPQQQFFLAVKWITLPQNLEEQDYFDSTLQRRSSFTSYHPFFAVDEIPRYRDMQNSPTELFLNFNKKPWFPLTRKANQRLNISVSYKY